jgi:hypothetical protein
VTDSLQGSRRLQRGHYLSGNQTKVDIVHGIPLKR